MNNDRIIHVLCLVHIVTHYAPKVQMHINNIQTKIGLIGLEFQQVTIEFSEDEQYVKDLIDECFSERDFSEIRRIFAEAILKIEDAADS